MQRLKFLGVFLLVVAVGVISGITSRSVTTAPATPTAGLVTAPAIQTKLAYNPGCQNAGYIPNGCIFGIPSPSFVVESASYYEYGLVPGSTPIGDYDYGTNHVERPVHMPGGSWDHYPVVAVIGVAGSGTVVIAHTPNGGTFSLVHLDGNRVRPGLSVIRPGLGGLQPTPLPLPPVQRLSDGELTAEAVARIMAAQALRPGLHAGQVLRGGDFVAMSQWPTDPAFGNGSAGPANAHLCVVLDGTARAWFLALGAGHDAPRPKPKVKPFPRKAWGARAYKDRHGHLLWQTREWLSRQKKLGHYTDHDRWHQARKKGGAGYMAYGFQRALLDCWPKYHRCVVRKR